MANKKKVTSTELAKAVKEVQEQAFWGGVIATKPEPEEVADKQGEPHQPPATGRDVEWDTTVGAPQELEVVFKEPPAWLEEVRHWMAHPYLDSATSLSSRVLDLVGNFKKAGKSPITMIAAAGSAFNIVTEIMGADRVSPVGRYCHQHDWSVRSSTIGTILEASDLFEKMGLRVLATDEEDHETLMGLHTRDGRGFGFLVHASEGVRNHIYGSEDVMGDLGSSCFSTMLRRVLWDGFGASGIELGQDKEGAHRLSPLSPCAEYIGSHDPVDFADEVMRFRSKGLSKAVILHGPPGTGKTEFAKSYAELTRSKLLVVGPAVYDNIRDTDFLALINALEPDIILLDDLDKGSSHKISYTTIPAIRRLRPTIVFILTCNAPESLGAAYLRPGRGGELVEFGPPTPQERLALLTLYFQKSGIDAQKFDIEELAYTMTGQYSHDWVKAMAEQALVYDTQETLLKYILDTNEKVRMISRLPDMARPGMEKAPRHKWGRKADLEAVAEAKTRVAKTKEWLAKQAQGTEPEEAPPFLDGDDSDEEEYDAESADGPNPNVWKFK